MHFLMFVVIFCWASNIIAGKEALKDIAPLALAQLRVLGAAVIYAVCFLVTGRMRRLQLTRRKWVFLIAMALNLNSEVGPRFYAAERGLRGAIYPPASG